MSEIALLSPHVANLIAAGEVVERPASVVKELVENALDAGARALTVELRRGGSSLIRVTDDGAGMDPEDAAMAFLRHATSKLRDERGLSAICTMGFRGEALAAVAAVSRVDLLTRRRGEGLGTALTLEAGAVTDSRPSGCPEGTTILVRDLFYNTPARQKFLKKDSTEAAHAQEAVVRAALGRPDVSMRLLRDGAEILHTPGGGDLQSCLYCLFGRDFAGGLLPVSLTRGSLAVEGFAGRPEAGRAGRAQQYFFVLGRPVRARVLSAALDEAYRDAMPAGRQPVCTLRLTLPPQLFDINVHPAKAEIRFSDERAVFDGVYHALKAALRSPEARPELRVAPAPGLVFRRMDAEAYRAKAGFSAPSFPRPPGRDSREETTGAPLPPECAPSDGAGRSDETASGGAGELLLLRDAMHPQAAEGAAGSGAEPLPLYRVTPPEGEAPRREGPEGEESGLVPSWRYIGQALGGILLVESPDCLWLIDKHAAHERLLYNRLKASSPEIMSQRLITPCLAALTAPEREVLLEQRDFLAAAGFDIEPFGEGVLAVRAGPFNLGADDIPALLSELAALLANRRRPDVRDEALRAVACKAAVKLGRSSADADMRHLARLVMETPDLRHCPHGRPVAIRLTRSQLAGQFGR